MLLHNFKVSGKVYKVKTSKHNLERMEQRNISVRQVLKCLSVFTPREWRYLLKVRDYKHEIAIKNINENVSVIISLRKSFINIVTSVDKGENFFVKGDTETYIID